MQAEVQPDKEKKAAGMVADIRRNRLVADNLAVGMDCWAADTPAGKIAEGAAGMD